MRSNDTEIAYCTGRIATSIALASAATDMSVRASHAGFAEGYKRRLADLLRAASQPIKSALSKK